MKYHNLFFDLDNTLWNFSDNANDTFHELYHLHHLGCYFDSFDQFFEIYQEENLRLWGLYEKGEITKDELNYRRFRYPLEIAKVPDMSIATECASDFFRIISGKKKLMPHAMEVLDYLYPCFNLYILSNGFKELQCAKMHSAGIDGYFRRVILSDDIGVLKPNRSLFDYALKVTESDKIDSIMIGDNFDVDIEGAYHSGWAQVYYNDRGENFDLPFSPTYLIGDLRELIRILR